VALRVSNQIVVENDGTLRSIRGYNSSVVSRMIDAVQSESHTFTIYNSSGTAIKTVSFVNTA